MAHRQRRADGRCGPHDALLDRVWDETRAAGCHRSRRGPRRELADVETALGEYETKRIAALAAPQRDSVNSARWFENVPRYLQFEPQQVSDLMDARRSRLLAYVGPAAYLRLRGLVKNVRALTG